MTKKRTYNQILVLITLINGIIIEWI